MSVPLRRPASIPAATTAVAAAPRAVLSVGDAVALIVGTVIGAGIFRTPPLVAANAGSETTVLVAWVLGGAISLMGALCYAELASTFPGAGGEYHYLMRAYGRRIGFLFAWARLSVIQTGSIALLAFVLGDYATQLYRLGPYSSALYAAIAVVVFTGLNAVGVRQGKLAQNLLTAVEVAGVLLIVATGIFLARGATDAPAGSTLTLGTSSFGLVMVFVLLTYGGWNEAAYLSAEIRDPHRNMARVFLLSLALVTVLYLVVNWALLATLGLHGVARSEAVAADVMQRALGDPGARLVSLLIVVSAATSANAAVFTGARMLYAFGRDVAAFSRLGRWHPGARTPANALLIQGALALALVTLGALTRKGFETMVEYTAPVFWLFFLLTGASLLVLRITEPGALRPFRVPLYPLTPLVFCGASAYLLYASLTHTGVGALVGVGVLAVGVLVLALATRGAAAARTPS
jgi:amino acid transporter